MNESPEHVHRISAIWWEIVDGLVKNNFPENQAYNIVQAFFHGFSPLPRDKVQILEIKEKEP